jgi:hypothetical protein
MVDPGVLPAVVIIAVIALVASSAGRRRRAAAQWRTDTPATLDEIDQSTMRLPSTRAALGGA